MDDTTTSTDTSDATDTARLSARFQQWPSRSPFPSTLQGQGTLLTAAYTLLFAGNVIGLAAAQASGGGGGGAICGTAIATTVNEVVPLALTVTVFGGLILSYLLHAYSGFKKDPNKVTQIKNWRNRAGLTALSAPLFGKLLEIVIGFIGLGLAGCIEIVPGI